MRRDVRIVREAGTRATSFTRRARSAGARRSEEKTSSTRSIRHEGEDREDVTDEITES